MKHADIRRILEAGLITPEQERNIIEHFHLKPTESRLLTIISVFGALLIFGGIVLLIAANWDEIPRLLKVGVGLVLMLGAHGAGYYLRDVRQDYPKVGEALHLVGSCLFLGNIALVGQVYHLSSRPPNAFLLWVLGIAALPWLLRSAAQHFLVLVAVGIWFGMEINEPGSWFYFGNNEEQVLLYSLLGLIYAGVAYLLRLTSFRAFADPTEKLGLLGFHCFLYPTTWGLLSHVSFAHDQARWALPAMAIVAALLVVAGSWKLDSLPLQWRIAWGGSLCAMIVLMVGMWYLRGQVWVDAPGRYQPVRWIFTLALFAFCLLEVQVGIHRRAEYVVNLAVAFLALTILSAYINLFGSMARTGVMFLVSGVFLIAFGVYLEKRRRTWLRELKEPISPENLSAQ